MALVRNLVGRRSFLIASVAVAATVALDKVVRRLHLSPEAAGLISDGTKRQLKAAVVYYSATGSTTKAALAIHRGLSTVIDCDIIPLKKANPKKMAKYDLIGLGGPIWYSRETANLKLFVHNMPQMPGKLSFLFCTHGTGPDGFMWSLSQTVLKRALTIIGWNDWYGSVFQVLLQPKPYVTDGHPDAFELQEAETFGREMGERAKKVFAGDRSVIPEIPTGEDAGTLWLYRGGENGFMNKKMGGLPGPGPSASGGPGGPSSASGGPGGSGAGPTSAAAGLGHGLPGVAATAMVASPAAKKASTPLPPGGGPPGGPMGSMAVIKPTIDLSKCVYPRCTACEDVCPVNAIEFSLNANGRLSSNTELLIKNACVGCALCERVCIYDAAVQGQNGPRPKTSHAIDVKKCTYPHCTLCADLCPMNAIDLTQKPPVVHHNCEGCDLCWCVCPTGAMDIPNIAVTQIAMRHIKGTGDLGAQLEVETKGKFRSLVKAEDVGWDTPIYMNQNTPRIVVHDDGNTDYCYKQCKL